MLLAAIRLANWNVANGPNTAVDEANFETVIDAIGNEVVQGTSRALDVLVLSETDSSSAEQLEGVFDNLYSTSAYEHVFSTADGGSDRTGFVYNSETVSLLDTFELNDPTLTHHILRGQFRPVNATAAEDFFVYAVHLVSGTDQQARANEAAFVRSDADQLGSDANIIYAGDFNLSGSSEAAYTSITASGAGSAFDPADVQGEWSDNPAFRQWHTHSTLQVDDRFDLQFISEELTDGIGLDYVDDSITVFGNNGTHIFDEPVTTGTGATPEVLESLLFASDHLPVFADFEIVAATPGVIISPPFNSANVVEGGADDFYEISLRTVPTDVVTLTVTPGSQADVGAGPGNSIELAFSSETTLTHIINVSADDDPFDEGVHFELIEHSLVSLDVDYDQLAVEGVTVTIADDDSRLTQPLLNEILVNPTGADDNREYIEIIGPANELLTDVWLLEIEGDGNGAGIVDNATNLSSLTLGSNGLLLLGDDYLTGINPWQNELAPATSVAELVNAPIENGTITFLLVDQFTAGSGFDLDVNNDGVIDNAPWLGVFDSVAWTDGGANDQVYSSALLSQSGVPDAASRIPVNLDAESSAAWYHGDVVGELTREYGNNVSSNLPEDAVITPGSTNFFPFSGALPARGFSVPVGTIATGSESELQFSDDEFLQVYSAVAPPVIEPAIVLQLQAFVPVLEPDSLAFVIETRANTPNVEQQVELFNFDNQQFEVVSVTPASFVDGRVEIELNGLPSSYISQNTGELRATASWTAIGPVFGSPWSIFIDQAGWEVNLSATPSPRQDRVGFLVGEIVEPVSRSEPQSSVERGMLSHAGVVRELNLLPNFDLASAHDLKPDTLVFAMLQDVDRKSFLFDAFDPRIEHIAAIDEVFELEPTEWPFE